MIQAPAPSADVRERFRAACADGDAASLRALLGQPDAPDVINQKDSSGLTPLAHACANGHEEVARMLLAHPALVWRDEHPIATSPVVLAARNGHSNILEFLLSDPTSDKAGAPMEEQLCSAMHAACEAGRANTAAVLLAHRPALASARDGREATPLWKASRWGSVEVVELLLALNAADTDSVAGEYKSDVARELDEVLHPTPSIPQTSQPDYLLVRSSNNRTWWVGKRILTPP